MHSAAEEQVGGGPSGDTGMMEASASDLLVRKDWAALKRLFGTREPRGALEYQARALMNLHAGGTVEWSRVAEDFRQACVLDARDPLLRANFAEALLAAGQYEAAYEQALIASSLGPDSVPVLDKRAFAAAATRRWDESLDALTKLLQVAGDSRVLPAPAGRLLEQLQTRWWKPLDYGPVRLVLPQPEHEPFLHSTFGNVQFMRRFHRFQQAGSHAVRRFIDLATQSPLHTRRLEWVVQRRDGACVGLAGLVDIDWSNRRAELLVGFPEQQQTAIASSATVAVIGFAFEKFRLDKLVSYVYGDNLIAQRNTVRLGFTQEGLLRRHIATADGRLDLFVNGLLRSEFDTSRLLQQLRRRWDNRSSTWGVTSGESNV